MAQRAEFRTQITLSREEIFDLVASCDEVVGHAEDVGEMSIAFEVDATGRFLLGRLMGEPGTLDE
jgi:uncharacterized protein Yka (UPF0111/DUF47 family)